MKPEDYYDLDLPEGPGAVVKCYRVIEELGMPYHVGTAFAYLWRALFKGQYRSDLEKARDHITFELERLDRIGRHASLDEPEPEPDGTGGG